MSTSTPLGIPSGHADGCTVPTAMLTQGEGLVDGDDLLVVRLRDADGLRYLEPLLGHPGRSFHVADLIHVAVCPDGRRPAAEDEAAEAVERARKAVTNRIR